MPFPVKWFSSAFRGAPTLNGQAGTLIATLEACLIDGFGEITPSAVSVSGGVATATHASGDFFEDYAVIKISGATDGDLNGEARVISHTSTTTTWATTAADGSKAGTIKLRYAPVGGWEKSYSGTNKAVFKSTDGAAHGHYLRIDDSAGQNARLRGFESMTDVDTGSGPFPTDAQISGGGYWRKSQVASAAAVPWHVVADARAFVGHFLTGIPSDASNTFGVPYGFGDPVALAPGGDSWSTFLTCTGSSGLSVNMLHGSLASTYTVLDNSYGGTAVARAFGGLGGAAATVQRANGGGAVADSGVDTHAGTGPSTIDGRVLFSSRAICASTSDFTYRAYLPGVLHIPQNIPSETFSNGDTMDGSGALAGRRIMILKTARYPTTFLGYLGIDITGPWR